MGDSNSQKILDYNRQLAQSFDPSLLQQAFATMPSNPPFGRMRYEDGGQGTGMDVPFNDHTGFFVSSSGPSFFGTDGSNQGIGTGVQGISQNNLTNTSHRDRTQGTIMGEMSTTENSLSATQVARALGAENGNGLWEWLHLVAFSIGPTCSMSVSDSTKEWLKRSDQTAQIHENLILGTKEANSAMLTFETALKQLLQSFDGLTLDLCVMAMVTWMDVPQYGAKVPCSDTLRFDYMFKRNGNQVSPPAAISFSLVSHQQPSFQEFASMYQQVAQNISYLSQVNQNNMPNRAMIGMDKL